MSESHFEPNEENGDQRMQILQQVNNGPVLQQMSGSSDSMKDYGGPNSQFCSATMGGRCQFDKNSADPNKCKRCGVVKNFGSNDDAAPVVQQISSNSGGFPVQQIVNDGPVVQQMTGGPDSMKDYGGPNSRFCSATMGGSCTFNLNSDEPNKCTRCGVVKNFVE